MNKEDFDGMRIVGIVDEHVVDRNNGLDYDAAAGDNVHMAGTGLFLVP